MRGCGGRPSSTWGEQGVLAGAEVAEVQVSLLAYRYHMSCLMPYTRTPRYRYSVL